MMKKVWLVIGLVLLVVVIAPAMALRPSALEPFQPTAKESARLAVYQQPEAWFVAHLQEPPILVDGQRLDPKLQYLLENDFGGARTAGPLRRWCMEHAIQLMFATSWGRAKVRSEFDRTWLLFAKPEQPMAAVEDRWVEGRSAPIRVRVYHPSADPSVTRPILVYAHGGGYILGSMASMDRVARLLAQQSGSVVVSVDYRLAPEHPYPAASDDGEDVFLWVRAHAAELGGDPQRVAIGGDSAGGHVAVNVAQRLLARQEAPPAALLLYYPALTLPVGDPSYQLFGQGFGLDASFFDFLLPRVFPGRKVSDPRDDFIDPLHAKRLAGLPPTVIAVAGFDVLRDSGAAFAKRLASEGVPVSYTLWPSLTHNFLQLSGIIETAERATVEPAQALGRQLRAPAGS